MRDVWSLYSEKVMEHFRNPRNVGEIENPDGVGHVGNPVCGDIMELYVRVSDGTIAETNKMHCLIVMEEALKLIIEER